VERSRRVGSWLLAVLGSLKYTNHTVLGDQYAKYPDLFSGVAQAYRDVVYNKFL
jgi:hypothetical protein